MKKILTLFFLVFSCNSIAFPISILSCANMGRCGVLPFSTTSVASNQSFINGNAITTYNLIDYRPDSGFKEKKLIEYQLGTASYRREYESSISPTTDYTSYSGSLWLELDREYSLTESTHSLTVHFDQVTPPGIQDAFLQFSNYTIENSVNMLITSDGLLSGLGQSIGSYDDRNDDRDTLFDENGNNVENCLAGGCYSEVTLNLLTLQYVDINGIATFVDNPQTQETRELLFTSINSCSTCAVLDQKNYSLGTVPLPPSMYLFISGILILLFNKRKKMY